MARRFIVTPRMLADGKPSTALGRYAWALMELHKVGEARCTPISQRCLPWSAYIYKFRVKRGVIVETKIEPLPGQLPCRHARYVLRTRPDVLSGSGDPPILCAP